MKKYKDILVCAQEEAMSEVGVIWMTQHNLEEVKTPDTF